MALSMNLRPVPLASLPGLIWASPCSLIGLVLAIPLLLAGGEVQRCGRTVECWLRQERPDAGSRLARLPFVAITLGHVILGVSRSDLEWARAHEQVHVRQYEWLGPLFFIAYPLGSLLALLRGRRPYRCNPFELQAIRIAGESTRDTSGNRVP